MDRRFEFVRRNTSRIVVGAGVESMLPELVRELEPDGVVVLHDAALPELAARIVRGVGAGARLSIPGGEASKRLAIVGDLARSVRLAGATRRTVLVAVGGGTVCDLVGMLAAVLLRGVPLVLCPTTTLAMCDAALGGKNGVDHDGRKNELGTIRQPEVIAADIDWLHKLPDELFREGLVEVVKKAAVLDAERFARLEQLARPLAARDPGALIEVIDMAVAMKMAIVMEDETEQHRRRSLNFGHTIGHAIESSAEGKLRHGTCVGLGMLLECRAAGVEPAVRSRIDAVLASLGLPKAIPAAYAHASSLWRMARTDKKVVRGSVPMIVPKAIGECVEVELTEEALARALREP